MKIEEKTKEGSTGSAKDKAQVFIVDDHPVVRAGLERLLNRQTDMACCGGAESAAAAMTALSKTKPDAVVVDVSLRGVSGIELVKNILAVYPKLPVLMFSVMEESVFALRALKAGSLGYVMKHEPPSELLRALREVIKGNIAVSPKVATRMLRQATGQSATGQRSPIDQLSDRELEVLEWIGRGQSTREVADHLHLSSKTIEAFRANIKRKLDLNSNSQMVHYATRWLQNQGLA